MGEIPRVSVKDLTPLRFLEDYAVQSRPVVLLDVVQSWPCWEQWRDTEGQPKLKELSEAFVGCQGPVENCQSGTEPDSWDVGSFLGCLAQGEGCEDLYLKDWHFVHACESKQIKVPYKAPKFLQSALHDWLNHFKLQSKSSKEDYRFCYIGAKGTGTVLHHDVLFSHSWSANICGRKHWIFYPPDTKDFLEIRPGVLPPSARPDRYEAKDFPEAFKAYERRLEVTQEAGELVFVPSGWYHEVENLDLAISINHNWLNASNARGVWKFLEAELERTYDKLEDEMENFGDEKAWLEHCHMLMQRNCDMNIADWLNLLTDAWQVVKSCFAENPTGERLREVEWVEEKLQAVCLECLKSTHVSSTEHTVYAAARLKSALLEPFKDVMKRFLEDMHQTRQKYDALREEHRVERRELSSRDVQLAQRILAYEERLKRFQDGCQSRLSALSN